MKIIPRLQKFVKKNSSTILACIGAAGVIGTSVLVAKEAPEVRDRILEKEDELGEELSTVEKVKEAVPVYIPAIAAGVGTIACIFGVDATNKKRIAALEGAYILLEQTYKEYRSKVKELCGDETYRRIDEEIARDHYQRGDLIVDTDKILFYDAFSKRYFESTMLEMSDAELNLNKMLHSGVGRVSANDAYSFMGDLNWQPAGDAVGWNIWGYEGDCDPSLDVDEYSWIKFNYEIAELDDGLECYILTFSRNPSADYMDY